ncbi:MAG: hypothetical protein GY777_19880 [Candidatus Brocadiaceae bacterium]|nr:hypothetical protein [Candidatus Brocadiaceae bacterium]
MKRVNNLYDRIITFENVLLAAKKARAGRKFRASTAMFEYNREKNIFKIIDVLKNKTYNPGRYKEFYIYDPKKRVISAAPYFDRVIHHALMNILGPVLETSFIFDSYACIKDKGTHKAIDRYKTFQLKNRYVLKCDIVKYFQNIDHEILFDTLKNRIKCKDTLWLLSKIIGLNKHEDDSAGQLSTQKTLFSTRQKGYTHRKSYQPVFLESIFERF